MTDWLDIADVELQLFPKPVRTWTPDEWAAFFVTAQRLVDKYGKEDVLALVNELVLVGAGDAVAADALRHSVR